jgi:hypothetical protein
MRAPAEASAEASPIETTKAESGDEETSELKLPKLGPADVAIFWDYENVRIPAWCPPSTATEGIRNKVAKYGRIVEKRLYYDSRQPTEAAAPRAELDLSGFTLVDCPSRNRKETLDKKLIVDVLCFAWERVSMGAKACVVLITSDGENSYVVARLRDIGVFTVVFYRPDNVAKVLIDNSNIVMSWEFDVLGGPPSHVEDEASTIVTIESSKSVKNPDSDEAMKSPQEVSVKQPNQQQREKFAIFCNVVLNAQYRNVQKGISVYSSWAAEAIVASSFYDKIGDKDRILYQDNRTLASQKGFVEWGRRNLAIPGKPVIKVRNRDDRTEELSPESYLRLTYCGLALLKPNISPHEDDWKIVLPKKGQFETVTDHGSVSSQCSPSKGPKSTKNLFVGGLAWQTTENSLHSYFRQFGPLERVTVMHGRGFGFVLFKEPNDAKGVLKHTEPHMVDKRIIE